MSTQAVTPKAREQVTRSHRAPRRPPFRFQLPVASAVSPMAICAAAVGVRHSAKLEKLTALLKVEYSAAEAVLCGSGTQALQLAVQLAWRRTDRRGSVALPAFACFDVATAALGAGAPVSFFDVDPSTLAPDLSSLEAALQRGASVVVVAPLYGVPVAWDPIADLCARFGAILIEDAAQGHGALWRSEPVGSHGDLSILSFGRGKGWTGGGGGAVLARQGGWLGELHRDLRPSSASAGVRALAGLGAQWLVGRPSIYGVPATLPFLRLGETVYHAPAPAQRMPAMAVSLAIRHHRLARLAVDARRGVAEYWRMHLGSASAVELIEAPAAGEAGYLRFPLLLPRGMAGFPEPGEALRAGISESYPRILPDLEVMQPVITHRSSWPGARTLVRTLLTLPTHHMLSQGDLLRVVQLVRSYASKA